MAKRPSGIACATMTSRQANSPMNDVRGPLEEALVVPPGRLEEVVPGQSGAEGLADLPNARADDPADGP